MTSSPTYGSVDARDDGGDSRLLLAKDLAAVPLLSLSQPRSPVRSWLSRVWEPADLPDDERRLLRKVDASLLVFAGLGYMLKSGLFTMYPHSVSRSDVSLPAARQEPGPGQTLSHPLAATSACLSDTHILPDEPHQRLFQRAPRGPGHVGERARHRRDFLFVKPVFPAQPFPCSRVAALGTKGPSATR